MFAQWMVPDYSSIVYVRRTITQRDSTHSIWVKVPVGSARAAFLIVIMM